MDNLRGRASRALLWDLFGNYGSQISSFVISIFLARLLSPEDFGLVGMSMVFIGILQIFKDMGFASALIQNEDNTSLTYSSVFYLNIFAGFVISVLIFFSAPLIGNFYENETIVQLVQLLSITFFLSSFNIVQSTILSKDLNFRALTYRNLASQIVAGVFSICLAYFDYGVYALVIQQIIAALVSTILIWNIADWKPKLEFSWTELRKLSSFSIYVFAARSVGEIIKQLDTLIVGKLFSPATLGFFSRANSLNGLIIKNSSGSITKVFFPTLAKVKSDNQRFEQIFIKVINIVSTIAIFLTAVFYLVGEELIIGLFGSKWRPSIPIFQILILKGFTYPISAMIVNAFMAKGKSKENFYFGNIRKLLQLLPFVFAYFGGFYPFLYANLGVALTAWALNNLFANISLKIPFKKQFLAVLPHLGVAFLIVLGIHYLLPNQFSYFWAVVKVIGFSLFFFTYLKLTKSPILSEGNLLLSKLTKRLNVDKQN